MGNGPAPAKLPGEAPQQLEDFVACRASSVELDTDSLGWVPSGGLGDAAPSITMTPGASPTEATIRVGWDFIGLDLPASIGANGELVVDTSNVPGIASEAKDGIDEWVGAFNATMAANGKRLDGFTVNGTKVTITKRAIAAAAPTERIAVVPPATAAPVASSTAPTTPEPAPEEATPPQKGCLAWALGLLAVVGVGAGVFFATRDGGTDEVATSIVASTDAPPATEFAPATDVAPATPPATDAPDSTDAPADTAAPATDVVATDAPPPSTEPPPPSTAPPTAAKIPDPYAGVVDELDTFIARAFEQHPDDVLWSVAPDASGDVIDCNASTPLGTPGPDLTGLIGTVDIDDDIARLIVLMAQSPTDTADDFSFAVLLQTITVSNQQELYQWETHDGVQSIGQLDGAGNVIPGTESIIRLDDDGFPEQEILELGYIDASVLFDSSDPIVGVGARAFNTPREGDPLACDELFAVPFDSPLPLSTTEGSCNPDAATACVHNGRFAVTLVGPDGPATPTASDFDDATGFESGGFESGDLDAWARVVNGCSLSDTFWVFAAATTDVEYTMSVTDTASGTTKVFENPLGPASLAITDTSAFATCP